MDVVKKNVIIGNSEVLLKIFGRYDENINLIEKSLDVSLHMNESSLIINGKEKNVNIAEKVIKEIIFFLKKHDEISKENVKYIISLAQKGKENGFKQLNSEIITYTTRGKPIKPKTLGQKKYVDMIKKNDVVFGIGPAGTGKTYLAMAMAITAFKNGEVERMVLTRPAVEAGEKLGFLPGDMQDKVDPYLRPLYDALFEIMGAESFEKNMEKGKIEVAPLAYMRGRTLENAYIILDEAQNTTPEQMKMFLTRFGAGSKVVVTGDITQIDLPHGKQSGLKQIPQVLENIEGVSVVQFSKEDVVRHRLVQQIIDAYDRYEKKAKFLLESKNSKNEKVEN